MEIENAYWMRSIRENERISLLELNLQNIRIVYMQLAPKHIGRWDNGHDWLERFEIIIPAMENATGEIMGGSQSD